MTIEVTFSRLKTKINGLYLNLKVITHHSSSLERNKKCPIQAYVIVLKV